MDVKEKCSRTVVFYLAKSFTKRLEASEFHDSMMFLTSSMNFASVLIHVMIGSPRKLQDKYREMLRTLHCIE